MVTVLLIQNCQELLLRAPLCRKFMGMLYVHVSRKRVYGFRQILKMFNLLPIIFSCCSEVTPPTQEAYDYPGQPSSAISQPLQYVILPILGVSSVGVSLGAWVGSWAPLRVVFSCTDSDSRDCHQCLWVFRRQTQGDLQLLSGWWPSSLQGDSFRVKALLSQVVWILGLAPFSVELRKVHLRMIWEGDLGEYWSFKKWVHVYKIAFWVCVRVSCIGAFSCHVYMSVGTAYSIMFKSCCTHEVDSSSSLSVGLVLKYAVFFVKEKIVNMCMKRGLYLVSTNIPQDAQTSTVEARLCVCVLRIQANMLGPMNKHESLAKGWGESVQAKAPWGLADITSPLAES